MNKEGLGEKPNVVHRIVGMKLNEFPLLIIHTKYRHIKAFSIHFFFFFFTCRLFNKVIEVHAGEAEIRIRCQLFVLLQLHVLVT